MGRSEIDRIKQEIREELAIKAYREFTTNLALWLPTGTGKSAIALKCCKRFENPKVLIVLEKNVHKSNWEKEIQEFNPEVNPTFTHYNSLGNIKEDFDVIIFDEADCLITDERLQNALNINGRAIFLAARINNNKLKHLKRFYKFNEIQMSLFEAIHKGLLPKPTIRTYPVDLREDIMCIYEQGNNKSKKTIEVDYKDRFKKNVNLRIRCNQKEYYSLLINKYEYFKQLAKKDKYEGFMMTKYIKQGLDIKKWLDSLKLPLIEKLFKIKGRRLIFTSSIENTKLLGNAIHSENSDKENEALIEAFNNGSIDYIVSVGMLIRAMNLYNVEHSIIGTHTEDGIILEQMLGRSLRFEFPTIHIPYIRGTKDEEKLLNNLNRL